MVLLLLRGEKIKKRGKSFMLGERERGRISPISKVGIFAKGFSMEFFFFFLSLFEDRWIDGCFCERKLGFNGT